MELKNFAICYNPEIVHSAEVKNSLKQILDLRGVKSEIVDIDALKE